MEKELWERLPKDIQLNHMEIQSLERTAFEALVARLEEYRRESQFKLEEASRIRYSFLGLFSAALVLVMVAHFFGRLVLAQYIGFLGIVVLLNLYLTAKRLEKMSIALEKAVSQIHQKVQYRKS